MSEATYAITKLSMFGRLNMMEFPVRLRSRIETWQARPPIARQHVQVEFPDLDAAHREFLLTGITPEEWAAAMGLDEEEE